MSYLDTTSASLETLSKLATADPEHGDVYNNLSNQLEQKLYHPLTVAVHTFISDNSNARPFETSTNFLALYSKILTPLRKKLNPLTLAHIASNVSFALSPSDAVAATALLEEIVAFFTQESHSPAALYSESKLHLLKLHQTQVAGTAIDDALPQSIQAFLKKSQVTLAELGQSTESELAVVHSSFYQTAMTLYKAVGPPEAFYTNALQYLHYTPLPTLEASVQYQLAQDMCLAALTGKGIYDFGQIVYHPADVLSVLKGTELEWLSTVMDVAVWGKVDEWKELQTVHQADIERQPALLGRMAFVDEKIALLALVHMVFERESGSKTITFEQVAERVKISVEQVELFLIRALALELIKGTMDQVDGTVDVTWVIPRVLDDANVAELAGRFKSWIDKTGSAREFMDEHQPAFS